MVESVPFFRVHEIMACLIISGILDLIKCFRFDEYFRLWGLVSVFFFFFMLFVVVVVFWYLWLLNFLSKLLFQDRFFFDFYISPWIIKQHFHVSIYSEHA